MTPAGQGPDGSENPLRPVLKQSFRFFRSCIRKTALSSRDRSAPSGMNNVSVAEGASFRRGWLRGLPLQAPQPGAPPYPIMMEIELQGLLHLCDLPVCEGPAGPCALEELLNQGLSLMVRSSLREPEEPAHPQSVIGYVFLGRQSAVLKEALELGKDLFKVHLTKPPKIPTWYFILLSINCQVT
jgi:hypothetical protein